MKAPTPSLIQYLTFKLNTLAQLSEATRFLTVNPLGRAIKELLAKRGITARELSERINLSQASVSKIVQGVTKPRQANLTRIIQELCATPEEEQFLISAFGQIEAALENEQAQRDQATFQKIDEERVRRYLQAKAQSIAFRDRVAQTLKDADIKYESPFSNSDVICDFLIPGPPRVAIECKANPTRDWDRTITSANLFMQELPCDRVLVVVPDLQAVPVSHTKTLELTSLELLATNL